jgi:hypothetical protein
VRARLTFGFACIFAVLAAVLFLHSSPKLPISQSLGGPVDILVSDPTVKVSLDAEFQWDRIDTHSFDSGFTKTFSSSRPPDALPGRYVIYTITVAGRIGSQPTVLFMLFADSQLKDPFFVGSGGPFAESRPAVQHQVYSDSGSRSPDSGMAQYISAVAPIGSGGVGTLTLAGTPSRNMVARSGASADVVLPTFAGFPSRGAKVRFSGIAVSGTLYGPSDFRASITVGDVPSSVRIEYVSPQPSAPNELTWKASLSRDAATPGLTPHYAVTNRYEESRLSHIVFLAGIFAGIAGAFTVEASRDVIDGLLGRKSIRTTGKTPPRRPHRVPVPRPSRGRRPLPPHMRKRIAMNRMAKESAARHRFDRTGSLSLGGLRRSRAAEWLGRVIHWLKNRW